MIDKKKKGLTLLLQIVAILLIGIVASVGTYLFIQDKNRERFTVTFAYGNGEIIEQKVVKSGNGVIPPDFNTDCVFRGWDGIINNVLSNFEVHPSLYSIVEDNLFYFDTVYAREGRNFSIDLMLAGEVNISNGELTLEYDEKVIEYRSFESNEAIKITQISPGKLIVSFGSDEILTKKTELAQIKFYAKRKDVKYSLITLSANKANVVFNGEENPADCATINNNIYFLQEVG
ncbi:MAG: hypothetical protein IKB93_10535 [Clostridia bacterium]|nr:hypothetical protein [Clostridia bacterium]